MFNYKYIKKLCCTKKQNSTGKTNIFKYSKLETETYLASI